MSDDQLLAIASTVASNHFPRPTDDWEAKPAQTKHGQRGKPTTVLPTLPSVNSASGTAMPPSTANALIAEAMYT
eukprot:CCRYP_003770-RA/>CCRYP_003770-RA protein AED:0.41 eAED:0.41 QI:0/-1/0/1/-1/1/1/0/73